MSFFQLQGTGVDLDCQQITIASSGTVSETLSLKGKGLVGFLMPAAFTGTAITFKGSVDNSTFTALYNSSNAAYSITVAVDRFYCLNPQDFLGMTEVQFVSGSSEGAERSIVAVMRSLL